MRVPSLAPVAAISASALTVAGAITIMMLQGSSEPSVMAGPDMSTGVTVTPSAEATVISVSRAAPSITGPAPLPKEEQGLPG